MGKLIIPKKVIATSTEYEVLYFNDAYQVDPNKREERYGTVHFDNAQIRLYKKHKQLFKTFMHEVLHVINHEYGIGWFNDERFDQDLDRIAVGLTDVLVRANMLRRS